MENLGLTHGLNADIIGPATSPMGASLGLNNPFINANLNCTMNPYCNTNYLGGITMAGQPISDIYSGVIREKHRNVHGIKKALVGIGSFAAGCFVLGKFRQLGKAISKIFKK